MDFSEYVKQSNKLLLGLMDSMIEKEFDKILDKKMQSKNIIKNINLLCKCNLYNNGLWNCKRIFLV